MRRPRTRHSRSLVSVRVRVRGGVRVGVRVGGRGSRRASATCTPPYSAHVCTGVTHEPVDRRSGLRPRGVGHGTRYDVSAHLGPGAWHQCKAGVYQTPMAARGTRGRHRRRRFVVVGGILGLRLRRGAVALIDDLRAQCTHASVKERGLGPQLDGLEPVLALDVSMGHQRIGQPLPRVPGIGFFVHLRESTQH
eukprot:scaffold64089_cov48-Phaeocystis_antarctica.AAC.1